MAQKKNNKSNKARTQDPMESIQRTQVINPRHRAYSNQDEPVHHLTPKARKQLGRPPFSAR